ncbi:MAG: hypothetical protein F7C34_04825 [Desulfurococcales archaeon]|nr:hypothetical protein [Desulfurococcales archaeon]
MFALSITGLVLGIAISVLPIVKVDMGGETLELSIDTVRLKSVEVSSWPGKFFGVLLGLYLSTQLLLLLQIFYYKTRVNLSLLSSYTALVVSLILARNIYRITTLVKSVLESVLERVAIASEVSSYVNDVPLYVMLVVGIAEASISSYYWLRNHNNNIDIERYSTYAGTSLLLMALVASLFAPHIVLNIRPIQPVGVSVGLTSDGVLLIRAPADSVIRYVEVYVQTVNGKYYLVYNGSFRSPSESIDISEAIRVLGGENNISNIIVRIIVEKDNQIFFFNKELPISSIGSIMQKIVDVEIYYNTTNLTISVHDAVGCSAIQYVEVFWHVYNLTIKTYTAGLICTVSLPSLGGPLTVTVHYTGPDKNLRSSSIVITSYGSYVLPIRVGVVG